MCEIHLKILSHEFHRYIFNVNFTWIHFYIKFTWKIHVKFPWKLFLLYCLFLVNIFSWISHAGILSVHWFNQIVEPWFIFQAMLVLCLSHTDSSNSLPELRKSLHRLYTTDRFLDTRRSSNLINNMYLRFVFWFYKIIGHQGDVWGGISAVQSTASLSSLVSRKSVLMLYLEYNWSYLLQTCIFINNISEGTYESQDLHAISIDAL